MAGSNPRPLRLKRRNSLPNATAWVNRVSMNYYNEHNPHAAAWLRALMLNGHIPKGRIDTRSILDVQPEELEEYAQCHFFAGIGGWPLALSIAGISPDAPVDTASCPCQPFSIAGNQKGNDDERHLWPHFRAIQQKRRAPIMFGEQVASKDGREWLAGICFDLEEMGYSFGSADLCAAGVGAPHVRQRLYWMAHANGNGRQPRLNWVPLPESGGGEVRSSIQDRGPGSFRFWDSFSEKVGRGGRRYRLEDQPGAYPLAHGVPGGVELLRGYGNAIVPPLAAAFVESAMGAIEDVFGGGWR